MQNNFGLSGDQLDALTRMAGQKLGKDPSQLREQLQAGQLDGVLQNLAPNQQQQLKSLMQNPAAVEQLIGSPQMQMLLKKLMGK